MRKSGLCVFAAPYTGVVRMKPPTYTEEQWFSFRSISFTVDPFKMNHLDMISIRMPNFNLFNLNVLKNAVLNG